MVLVRVVEVRLMRCELKALGVNRISMGVQSLSDAILAAMGRGYAIDEAERAFALVKTHFDNVGIDLIAGYPGDQMQVEVVNGLTRHRAVVLHEIIPVSAEDPRQLGDQLLAQHKGLCRHRRNLLNFYRLSCWNECGLRQMHTAVCHSFCKALPCRIRQVQGDLLNLFAYNHV